jgi:hypothetical protein
VGSSKTVLWQFECVIGPSAGPMPRLGPEGPSASRCHVAACMTQWRCCDTTICRGGPVGASQNRRPQEATTTTTRYNDVVGCSADVIDLTIGCAGLFSMSWESGQLWRIAAVFSALQTLLRHGQRLSMNHAAPSLPPAASNHTLMIGEKLRLSKLCYDRSLSKYLTQCGYTKG